MALIPPEAEALCRQGHEVLVEEGAGLRAGFPDAEFSARSARVVSRREALRAGVVVQVRTPGSIAGDASPLVTELAPGTVLIGLGDPLGNPRTAGLLADQG